MHMFTPTNNTSSESKGRVGERREEERKWAWCSRGSQDKESFSFIVITNKVALTIFGNPVRSRAVKTFLEICFDE